jgi:hypothetical protein
VIVLVQCVSFWEKRIGVGKIVDGGMVVFVMHLTVGVMVLMKLKKFKSW